MAWESKKDCRSTYVSFVDARILFINGKRFRHSHTVDIRESASVAHIYGQNLVAAERPYCAWTLAATAMVFYPEKFKKTKC